MSGGQLLRAELVAATAAGQLLRAELTTPTVAFAAGQLLRAELSTPPYTTVTLGPNRIADGLEQVSIDSVATGATPTSWTWSIQSDTSIGGPAGTRQAVLTSDGDSAVLTAPAAIEGATVVVGLVVSNGTTVSPLATVTVTVYPHLEWELIGGAWVPYFDDLA